MTGDPTGAPTGDSTGDPTGASTGGRTGNATGPSDAAAILERIVDSHDRGVGGGSAAALAGGMAAGLAGLVARLSESGEFGLSPARCRELADEADTLAIQLLAGATADADAYRAVVEAYRLPKDDAAAVATRDTAIQRAMAGAAAVPLANANAAHRVWCLCGELEGASNPNASSDLAVGMLLAEAAVRGCVYNVEINLPLINDREAAEQFRREAASLRGALAGDAGTASTEEEA